MLLSALLVILTISGEQFVVDATASRSFTFTVPADSLRRTFGDIGLLRRHMPGVVAIESEGQRGFLYRTERQMPFSEPVRTDFRIERVTSNDTMIYYRTPDPEADNYMSLRLTLVDISPGSATIRVQLRVRLVRDDGADIHVLAPVLGQDFISDRMAEDLDATVTLFGARWSEELMPRGLPRP
jgi:hypothetical protein